MTFLENYNRFAGATLVESKGRIEAIEKGNLEEDSKIYEKIESMEIKQSAKNLLERTIRHFIRKLINEGVSGHTELVNVDSSESEVQIGVMIDYEQTFGKGWGEDVEEAFDNEVALVEKVHGIAKKMKFKIEYNEENPQDFTNWTVFSLKVNA